MTVYRIECEDGGGPFYRLDGTPRQEGLPIFKNSLELYGADSIENLKKLISSYGFNFDDYVLKKYENVQIISYNKNNGHVIFRT